MKPFSEFLAESSLSRIHQHFMSDKAVGIITASRGEYDETENRKRNDKLRAALRGSQFGYIKVVGGYIENQGTDEERKVTEDSFIVVGKGSSKKMFDLLQKLAKEFNQDAFIFKGANTKEVQLVSKTGEIQHTMTKLKMDQLSTFYTALSKGSHAGRSFVFEGFVQITEHPVVWGNALGMYAAFLAESKKKASP